MIPAYFLTPLPRRRAADWRKAVSGESERQATGRVIKLGSVTLSAFAEGGLFFSLRVGLKPGRVFPLVFFADLEFSRLLVLVSFIQLLVIGLLGVSVVVSFFQNSSPQSKIAWAGRPFRLK
jgi:hypothetical protein